MEKYRGIWIDYQKALIVEADEASGLRKKVYSDLVTRERDPQQGRFGEQYVHPERKLEAKRKHLLKNYYRTIISELEDESELYIFGPAEARNEFHKELSRSTKRFKRVTVERCDSLTDNQVVAKVRNFFSN